MAGRRKEIDIAYEKELTKDDTKKRDLVGWVDVPTTDLMYSGLYLYPEGTRIQVKIIDVDLVRIFTGINETNGQQVDDAMNYLLKNNVRVITANGVVVDGDNILMHDRFRISLILRELSELGDNISYKERCCNKDVAVNINSKNLKFKSIDDKFKKYWNQKEGRFDIRTHEHGTINYFPLSCDFNAACLAYIRENKEIDYGFVKLLPLLHDFNNITGDMKILYERYEELSKEQLSVYNTIANNIEIAATQFVTVSCPTCGSSEFRINLPGGLTSLVTPIIQFEDVFS